MRVGVVNGVPAEIAAIRHALTLAPEHSVLWVAETAEDALELCIHALPDLVLMALAVGEMGGVEATRRLMGATPCAILIMATDIGARATEIFEAMGHGALDAIDTPALAGAKVSARAAAPFLIKIESINQRLQLRQDSLVQLRQGAATPAGVAGTLVAIGASAGGPAALRTVLQGLPRDFPAAVVIVQHLDQRFAQGMVDWLGANTALPIRICGEGDVPVAGTILLAGTGDHLVLKSAGRLGHTATPEDNVYRPSVDVFFRSVVRFWNGRAIGVILSGMGRDGAAGLKELLEKGHHTIAQDQASSVVYGMPKAAYECGAVREVLAAELIGARLIQLLSKTS